jgi:predicted glycoside hydrolase/deacetylase ChbG (UPF0249 family)
MTRRAVWERLGLSAERAVVVHADDVGMCEASLSAFQSLAEGERISSASVMVPCPWFPATAAWCRGRPAIDVGVHLTLNSEWAGYRWAPLLGSRVSSLQDVLGYFPRSPEELHGQARLDHVYLEACAQMDRAAASGLEVTHIDTHIFTLRHPRYVDAYLRLTREYRVPAALVRGPDPVIEGYALPAAEVDAYYGKLHDAEAEGLPLFDAWVDLPLDGEPGLRLDRARRVLDGLPQGLSCLLLHPARDTPELRAITRDAPARVADYELLQSDGWADALAASGVAVIGMRGLRDRVVRAPR